MRVIMIDHKNNLITFEARQNWVGTFFRNAELLSRSNTVAQDYIEECLRKETNYSDSLAGKNINKIETYTIQSVQDIEKLDPVSLSPSEDYGITIINLPLRQMASLNHYEDIDILRPMNIRSLLSTSHPRGINYNSLDEKKTLLENISALFENDVLDLYRNGYIADLYGGREEYRTKINDYITHDHTKIYDETEFSPVYYDFKISANHTGWKTYSDTGYDRPENYERLMRCLFDSGVVVSFLQEKAWHDFFQQYNKTDKINFDFLSIHREKEMLLKNVSLASMDTKTVYLNKI